MPVRAAAFASLAALASVAFAAAGPGCNAEVSVVPQQDASTAGKVSIHGRIFDLETCPDGVPGGGRRGGLAPRQPGRALGAHRPDGAFILGGVPQQSSPRLRAETTTGVVGSYVTTSTPTPSRSGEEDVFGVELYMLSAADGDLLGAIARESTRDLRTEGGYVGEVIRREPVPEAVTGAHVELFPADFPMRYVNVIPRYEPAEAVLQPAAAGSTSGFGLFVVAALDQPQNLGVLCTADGLVFEPLLFPMAPGTLAFGLHLGTPGAADGGTADSAPVDASSIH